MNTLVVNCFAGPGAGKTTCAWEVAAELKKKGINCEYVPEYPKELVWEEKYDLLNNQEHIFNEQAKRLARLRGKVEVIVTDSPILMSHIYGTNNSHEFTQRINEEYSKYYNFNLFIQRGKGFQQEGRVQNLRESIELDNRIKNMLKNHKLYFGVYRHENVKYIADNIIRNLEKIRNQPAIDIKSIATLPDAEVYDSLYGKETVKGYYITDKISINNETYIMGYNPEAVETYVTWRVDGEECNDGRYYVDKHKAKQNLFERALSGSEEIISEIVNKEMISESEQRIDDDNFDRNTFISGIEEALDCGYGINQEDYDLYQRLINERASEETESVTSMEDMEL